MDENLGAIANFFINKDKIYKNIKESLLEYLGNPLNQADLAIKIIGALERAIDTPIKSYTGKIPEVFKTQMINKAINYLKYEMSGELYDKIWEASKAGIAQAVKPNSVFAAHMEGFITEVICKWVSDNAETAAEKIPAFIMDSILKVKIGSVLREFPAEKTEAVKKTIISLIMKFIQAGAVHAAEAVDVGKLTKDQINAMDISMVEDIILFVARKELNAITYFGGVLGFIIGLLPMVFQIFL
jgi:uncharacterized membrane protein YheB (UPF0754 family)